MELLPSDVVCCAIVKYFSRHSEAKIPALNYRRSWRWRDVNFVIKPVSCRQQGSVWFVDGRCVESNATNCVNKIVLFYYSCNA
jgi:hypothetical protein